MEGLVRVQKDILTQITKAHNNFKKSPKARITKAYVEIRIDSLDKCWSEFEKNHKSILLLNEEDDYFDDNFYETIEEKYIEYKCDLKDALANFTDTTISQAPTFNPQGGVVSTAVKLPKITLPSFSGRYMEWPTFHDLFESLIHKNPALADVQKLHYLKSHLTGEAEQLLRHVPITDANYAQCWSQIKKRYSNKRYIATSILDRLFGQKGLTSESSNGIKRLLDTTTDCLNALVNLDVDVKSWDIMIIYLVTQKLDRESRKQWEQRISSNLDELPELDEFKEFLEARFRSLEFLEPKERNNLEMKPRAKVFSVTAVSCPFCHESHLLHQCKKFSHLKYTARHEFVQNNRLCYNCFGSNHPVTRCKRSTACRRCGRRHHSLLHPEDQNGPTQSFSTANVQCENFKENVNDQTVNHVASHFVNNSIVPGHVMLATAIVKVETNRACNTLRALLDQGSQASFITEHAVQFLGLRKISVQGMVTGLGGEQLTLSIKHMVTFKIQSLCTEFSYDIQAYVLNCLSSTLPTQRVEINDWPEFSNLTLADPGYGNPSKIDLLLGAEVYGQILTNGIVRNPSGTLTAQKTLLGWIVSGRVCEGDSDAQLFVSMHIRDHSVNELLRKFWELETDHPQEILSLEDKACEKYYESTTTRDCNGRYVVKLPFREETPDCHNGEFRTIALKRFHHLEKKFQRNPELKREYTKVINEYLELNHIEPITDEDKTKSSCVYLPHHAVVRTDKTTTKVRVVFDASCKGVHGKSLNDELMVGPRLQPELRHIIMNWRSYPICFAADIIKMYRQVKVAASDTDYQRLLWRENPEEDITDYRLLRVTFGVSSAPYLAVKTLQQIAKDEGENYPMAKERVLKHFYMDDLMSGCENEKEAIEIYNQITKLLEKGGFQLQKWISNSQRLIQEMNKKKEVEGNLEIKNDDVVKLLGLYWDVTSDAFKYKVDLPLQKEPITKRVILSDVSRLFDPLGWVSPVVIKAKIYMQKLWISGVEWDQEIPSELLEEWINYRDHLLMLNSFIIPRWVFTSKSNINCEVHGFCDASNDAYAAVAYLRVTDEDGTIHVSLIASRTKVAPIKQVSIPRLELCGAVLLSRLLTEISEVMDLSKSQLHAWTDSTIVLAWLTGEPKQWKTFVANRITEIISVLDNDQWSHIESTQNPADIASRGCSPQDLAQNTLWLNGPGWLSQPRYESSKLPLISTNLESVKVHASYCDMSVELPLWTKFSSLQKLIRVVAYCRRFICRLRSKATKLSPYLTAQELDEASRLCIQNCQKSSFENELMRLHNSLSVSKHSSIAPLCPFLDEHGLMRVRGRLQQSEEAFDVKHPIILPRDHHLSNLIVADAHVKTLHGGAQLMLNYIRSKYWIINIKNLIKRHIRNCVKCIRYSKSNLQPFMGELPNARVSPSRAFLRTGVDYAGPISIRMSKGRGSKCYKGYICVFVCMATRAIHLEAVSDMTADGFLAAFDRFVGRRGHCQAMWSDNGTNFIGASRELAKLYQDEYPVLNDIAGNLAVKGTEWHFIPPHAPNFGGLWEAGVKSTKFHLKRVLDGATLTFEELSTLLVKIEACLNSRPMYRPVSSGADYSVPLTPGHFLISEPLISVPNRNLLEFKDTSLSRWQIIQKKVQQFWKKWSQEYLTTLQNRYKWAKITPEPKIGDVVLVKEDGLPPSKWLFGIIEEKHPGADQITRVVTLKCKNSKIKRPISKLLILPIVD